MTSWWCLLSTIVLLGALMFVAGSASVNLVTSFSASVLSGFVVVRLFVIYHDFFHGAILRDSWIAHSILYVFGLAILSPAPSWKHAHNHHHNHNSNTFGAEIGGFPLMTTEDYHRSTIWVRLGYRIVRHPLIIVFGYFTSFLLNKTLLKFCKAPRTNMACGISMIVHFGMAIVIGLFSIKALVLALMVPLFIGSAFGTYLFYAQHNFPGMRRKEGSEWDYVYAALYSSSFMKLSPMMNWITGNIGYHHVHHLNAKIPFYRLPEAMDNLKELQSPTATSLEIADISSCLKLKLWDPVSEQLLTFRQARCLLP